MGGKREREAETRLASLRWKSWGHNPELVTAPSRVPPGSFNPWMDRAGLAPELLVHRSSDGRGQSVSFWKTGHPSLSGKSVARHKSQDDTQKCHHAGEIGHGSRTRNCGEILSKEPPQESSGDQQKSAFLKD